MEVTQVWLQDETKKEEESRWIYLDVISSAPKSEVALSSACPILTEILMKGPTCLNNEGCKTNIAGCIIQVAVPRSQSPLKSAALTV